jgi:ADP-ribose pyrophosphatase YjhB (NUDIX family)
MGRSDFLHDPVAPPANSVHPGAVALVQNDAGDVLLIQCSDNGRWALPGGGHDLGESIGETVRREVREETGLEVEVTDLSDVSNGPGHIMLYDDTTAVQLVLPCPADRWRAAYEPRVRAGAVGACRRLAELRRAPQDAGAHRPRR